MTEPLGVGGGYQKKNKFKLNKKQKWKIAAIKFS